MTGTPDTRRCELEVARRRRGTGVGGERVSAIGVDFGTQNGSIFDRRRDAKRRWAIAMAREVVAVSD